MIGPTFPAGGALVSSQRSAPNWPLRSLRDHRMAAAEAVRIQIRTVRWGSFRMYQEPRHQRCAGAQFFYIRELCEGMQPLEKTGNSRLSFSTFLRFPELSLRNRSVQMRIGYKCAPNHQRRSGCCRDRADVAHDAGRCDALVDPLNGCGNWLFPHHDPPNVSGVRLSRYRHRTVYLLRMATAKSVDATPTTSP